MSAHKSPAPRRDAESRAEPIRCLARDEKTAGEAMRDFAARHLAKRLRLFLPALLAWLVERGSALP